MFCQCNIIAILIIMMKRLQLVLGLVFSVLIVVSACKSKQKPLSERIAKAWIAETVRHNNTVVYEKGNSGSSAPGYSGYQLILGSDNTVTLTELDGTTFTGTWELQGETRLILRNLGPKEPTGSGGVVEYTIRTIEDNKLVLLSVKVSVKTGGTANEYSLTVR